MNIKKTCRDISALNPSAQAACKLFLEECKKNGLNVLVTETFRSQERQDYLYSLGRTLPGNKVTWTKRSRHSSGLAWDICKNTKGSEYSDKNFFISCGKIAEKLGITWGGKWKTPDLPHFEIPENWKMETEIDMEELEQLKKENEFLKNSLDILGDRVTKLENPMVYDYIDKNMPPWAKDVISKLIEKNILMGDENSKLGLNYDSLRILAILDRTGIFN